MTYNINYINYIFYKSSTSKRLEKNELKKFILRVSYYLAVFLSIWVETITEVDTLKIRKKGVINNDFRNI